MIVEEVLVVVLDWGSSCSVAGVGRAVGPSERSSEGAGVGR